MPYCYTLQSHTISTAAPYSTSATPATEIDFAFIKPGAGSKVSIYGLRGQGRGAGLTALSGIAVNVKNWTTASTGGTAMTPRPSSVSGAVAASATAAGGAAAGVNAVTAGSGGGTYKGGFGMGASGPGGWVAANPDAMIDMGAGYAGSCDLYSLCGTASILFDWWMEFQE